MLNAFTIGFLISISLTILRFQLFNDLDQLLRFHGILLSVLILRAVLDYMIGRRLYFPDTYAPAPATIKLGMIEFGWKNFKNIVEDIGKSDFSDISELSKRSPRYTYDGSAVYDDEKN